MSTKISNLKFRLGLEASGLDKDTIDKMTATAVANNIVSPSTRVGKLDFAPKEVKEAWNKFESIAKENLEEWNKNLPTGQEVNKVSLNCNK